MLEPEEEDVAQGSKGIVSHRVTGMSCIETQPAILDGLFDIRYIVGTEKLGLIPICKFLEAISVVSGPRRSI